MNEVIGALLAPGTAFLLGKSVPTYGLIVDFETVWVPAETFCMVLREKNRSFCEGERKRSEPWILIEYEVLVSLNDGNWAIYPLSSAALGTSEVQVLLP